MRRTYIGILACCVLAGTSRADFNSAEAAYGRGDLTQAAGEFEPLAEMGDERAQYNLSLMLANGRGVPRDFTAALGWSLAAQDNGVAQAAGVIDQLLNSTHECRLAHGAGAFHLCYICLLQGAAASRPRQRVRLGQGPI